MELDMSFDLFIRFYTSYGGKQKMWIEKTGCDGMRYDVNSINDARISFEQYITQIADNDSHTFDMRC